MMLGLLIYCYAQGVFSSRRIERATYRDMAVRYLRGNTHPDHDTICAFRRDNGELVRAAFTQTIDPAREMGILKLGGIAVDDTHIKASASKHKSIRHDQAGELERRIAADIKELLEKAEAADREGGGADEQELPQEIARRERLREKLLVARGRFEKRARQNAEEQERKGGEDGASKEGGNSAVVPESSNQINLTDPDSSLMRKSNTDSYEQAYNAQAVVDSEGSQLILTTDVMRTPSDANQLEPALKSVETLGPVQRMLADAGYVNADAIQRIQKRVDLYVAVTTQDSSYRQYDFRPPKKGSGKRVKDPRLIAMREKLTTPEGRRAYGRRAASVEPVFGIIKSAMGLRQFLLRCLEKVRIEWDVACLAYNVRRLWALAPA